MSHRAHTNGTDASRAPIMKMISIGVAVFAFTAAAPMTANAHGRDISINGLDFGDDEDLLEQLIELDADGIQEIREEMADAREEIADAILEIEDAREEVREAPGGAVIMKIALGTASTVVTKATGKVFKEVKADLNDAASELEETRNAVGEAEYAETTLAISVLREEIAELEVALSELTDAMRA